MCVRLKVPPQVSDDWQLSLSESDSSSCGREGRLLSAESYRTREGTPESDSDSLLTRAGTVGRKMGGVALLKEAGGTGGEEEAASGTDIAPATD